MAEKCIEQKITTAEREQVVDLAMHGIKRTTKMLHEKGICPLCSLDMYLIAVFMFHKDIGHVEPDEALKCMMDAYNRAYSGEAIIYEDVAFGPGGVRN